MAARKVKREPSNLGTTANPRPRIIHNFRGQGFAETRNLANSLHMEGGSTADRIASATARIAAAAGRIEAAANASRTFDTRTDDELEARYDALRREAGEALQQLDRLLESIEE